ncbi:polyhydroxybutyrate depolymerase [Rhizobium sp. TRM95111]|uniref:alpha/beta hydrolase family esterase n=1 Tax=Rhizobium alarense TaxID=2846851 RepID=UPI001F2EED7A|nr:polyhydroxybutyrate depolymerase [Rhizobium alarense]MCF3640920.1 polyhydroxybutyrate depolymerase [Rhizobium alarense]
MTATGLLLLLGFASPGLAAGCGEPVEAGRHEFTVTSGGVERLALVQIPPAYDGKSKLAVVFDFHGSNSSPAGQFRRSGWSALADREGFVAVALAGSLEGKFPGTHAWNVPGVTAGGALDDERFIQDAVKAAKDSYCIDPTRIYASGYSGGGRMLSQYVCNGHPDFAAAGFVMGLRAGHPVERDGVWQPDVATCKPGNPISIIAFSGMKDVTNPFKGGGKPYWQYGGELALQRWAELDGCEGKGNVMTDAAMTALSYQTCAGGARIHSYLLKENTHAWPARSVLFRTFDANGKVTSERDATGRMWDFFRNTRSPADMPLTAGDATERSG